MGNLPQAGTGRGLRGHDPRGMRTKNQIHIEDLYKSYGPRLILDNIDLSIRSGEFVSLVGPSGCGKSTLLRMILGTELPDSGSLDIAGRPATFTDSVRGIVFQRYESLYRHMTVFDNVAAGLRLQRGFLKCFLHRREIKDRTMKYLETVKLAEHKDKYPDELSGGMQQRVAIAQALILQPKVLLMDEPFSALDPGTRESMQVFTAKLWEETKMTIVFVTHNIEEAVFLSTRLITLSQYYKDDRPADARRGAKIVLDQKLPEKALSTEVKGTAEFASIVREVKACMDPAANRHVREFNLNHDDSFQTFASGEVSGEKQ